MFACACSWIGPPKTISSHNTTLSLDKVYLLETTQFQLKSMETSWKYKETYVCTN